MRRPRASRTPLAALTVGLAATLVGCSSGGGAATTTVGGPGGKAGTSTTPTVPVVGGVGRGRLLTTVADCDALLARLRDLALAHVTPWGLDGGGMFILGRGTEAFAPSDRAAAAPATTAAATSGSGASSGTNVQEAGVDEGDQVENDGRHVYSVLDGQLRVADTQTGTVSQAALPADDTGGGHQLVLDGDRLVVVSSGWGGMGMVADSRMPGPGGWGTTTITVLDVGEPMTPRITERRRVDGTAVAVRSADGTVRVVLTSGLGSRLPFVQPAQVGTEVEEKAKAINLDVVRTATIDQWLPRVGEAATDGTIADGGPALACDRVSLPTRDSGLGLTWVASVASDGAVRGSAAVVAAGGTTYASAANLFVSTTEWQDPAGDPQVAPVRPVAPQTALHRFALGDGGTATYAGSGVVPGMLLSSYSMSEHEGVLRVATTEQPTDGSAPTSSSVHTLRIADGELETLGAVTGLGRTEQIYAVRFVGPYGYVVTFRRTDPLYVIDLRDPAAPVAAGELKIPGYSAYLHPLPDGRLLGVGQNADGDGRVLGLQVSLFDVSDPTSPQRLANLDLGGASGAEWDPHAFLWWEGTGTAFVPLLPWWGGPTMDGGPERQGLAAVTVEGDDLRLAGVVAPPGLDATIGADQPDLAYQRMVQRAMVVDGRLVAVASGAVRVADLTSLATVRDIVW